MTEEWVAIDHKYEISNMGRVKRLARYVERGGHEVYLKEMIMKNQPDKKGYLRIRLNYKTFKVHRLVAKHFIINPLGLPQINHIDGDKANNNAKNLEWCTNDYNMKHARDNRLMPDQKGEKHPMSKLSVVDVREIKKMLKEGVTQIKIGQKFNVSRSCIASIKSKKNWSNVRHPRV